MKGSLGNNDGYGNTNKKVNSRCLKLYSAYSISFNLSYVGKFFCCWILKDFIKVHEKKKNVVYLCSRPRQNAKNRHFHVVVVHWRLRNVQKAWCTCKVVVLLISPVAFKGDVTRDDSQRRFLAKHSVAMLEQCCNHSKQCCNPVLR